MSVKDLQKLLKIRVFRRDEKERAYMAAQSKLRDAKAEKQTLIMRHKQLRAGLPGIMAAVQAKGASRPLTPQEWALAQAEVNQGRRTLVQLEAAIEQSDYKIHQAEEKMEEARLAYAEARKAYDRLNTMLEQLSEEARLMEEIMSESNDDIVLKGKNRGKKPIRGIKGRR